MSPFAVVKHLDAIELAGSGGFPGWVDLSAAELG